MSHVIVKKGVWDRMEDPATKRIFYHNSLSGETSANQAKQRRRSSAFSTRASEKQLAATDNAYRALRSLVEEQCDDPNLTLCRMSKVVAADGAVEWVTEASKARFEADGARCLIWNQHGLG